VYSPEQLVFSYHGALSSDDYAEYIDDDYADDFELARLLVDTRLKEYFSIPPTSVIMGSNEISTGTIFEWEPSKKIYVISIMDYIKLYKSFAVYLEDTHEAREGVHDYEGDLDVYICFRSLCESEIVRNLDSKAVQEARIHNPLFTADIFTPKQATSISTLNGVFGF
jgi:hypothetical protein